jgi:hypothetical protein
MLHVDQVFFILVTQKKGDERISQETWNKTSSKFDMLETSKCGLICRSISSDKY